MSTILGFNFRSPASTLKWLSEPTGKEFLEFVNEQLDLQRKALAITKDTTEIFRCQGAIMALERVAELHGRCRDFLDKQIIAAKAQSGQPGVPTNQHGATH